MGDTFDLFGREVFERIAGDTLPMFHEPVTVAGTNNNTAADWAIAAKFDAAATPALFAAPASIK